MMLCIAVAKFLESQGICHVFCVSGGANLWLIKAIDENTQIKLIPTTHECNAGFAADAYARVAGLGCALVTSGPGATNLVTAIATSYYDSVPALYISGQVASHRFGANYGVRQYGFQETPIVEMCKQITKYAVEILDPAFMLNELHIAVEQAQHGRKGPVLISIPDDFQRAEI